MKRTRLPLRALAIGIVLVILGGCGSPPINQSSDVSSATPTASPSSDVVTSPSASPQPLTAVNPSPSPSAASVVVYKVDDQCEKLVPEEVQVLGDRPMEAAVGKVLADQSNVEFALAGYRVSVSSNGTATVDFRLSPESKRKIVSLSTCEQLALFGAIEETLTKNPQWQIKSVRFTERGKEIVI